MPSHMSHNWWEEQLMEKSNTASPLQVQGETKKAGHEPLRAEKILDISPGNVATRSRCGGIFDIDGFIFTTESRGERILTTGQHLVKSWAGVTTMHLFWLSHPRVSRNELFLSLSRSSVCSFFPSDIVTAICHERLEQFLWNWRGIFTSPYRGPD